MKFIGMRRLGLAFVALAAAMAVIMFSCAGCQPMRWAFGFPSAPAETGPSDSLGAPSGSGGEPVKGDTFPYRRFIGFCVVGLALAGTCLLFGPTKHLAKFAFAGGVLLGTAGVIRLMFWDLMLGVIGLGILGGSVIGLLWLIERYRRQTSDKIADVQMNAIEEAKASDVKKRVSGKAALAGVDAELDKRLVKKGFKKK